MVDDEAVEREAQGCACGCCLLLCSVFAVLLFFTVSKYVIF